MDRNTFKSKVENIRQGNFPEDQSVFAYANDAIYETKLLYEALRQCCDWQRQKIDILKKLIAKLDSSSKRLRAVNNLFREKLTELGVDLDAILLEPDGRLTVGDFITPDGRPSDDM